MQVLGGKRNPEKQRLQTRKPGGGLLTVEADLGGKQLSIREVKGRAWLIPVRPWQVPFKGRHIEAGRKCKGEGKPMNMKNSNIRT